MRIAITGATGFIGRHVVAAALQSGHEVIASGISCDEIHDFPWAQQVRFEPLNLDESFTEPYRRLGCPDVVIHLAWPRLPNYQQMFHLEENLLPQYSFLSSLLRSGLRQLVVAGTCFEYGCQNGCLTEDCHPLPCTPYAAAKHILHLMLAQLTRVHPYMLQWVRLFYVYGPGQHRNSLLAQLHRALENGDPEFPMSGGEQLRDFIPVQRASEALVKIAEQTNVTGAINCCSGQPVSVRSFVERHLESFGASIRLKLGTYPYPDYEPMAFWGSTNKLRQAIGEFRG